MTKANSWRGHNTHLPPSPSQALATCPSRTKTKAEEELFVSKPKERKCRIPKKIRPAHRPQKSAFKPVDSDQFQIGPRNVPSIQRSRATNNPQPSVSRSLL